MSSKIIILCICIILIRSVGACAQDNEALWEKEISVGYNQATGNTQNNQLLAAFDASRKKESDEWTLKADTFYSEQNKKMDGQKHAGSVRYAFSFWEKKWYNFYKFAAGHDKFAKIDYRIIPSCGVGYWFSDTPNLKAMIEAGIGLEHTDYTDSTKRRTDTIGLPRVFLEKKMFDRAALSQDLVLFLDLEQGDEYRLRAETRFTNPLSDKMSLRVSFIDEFDSDPAGDTKKNDTQTMLSLVYSL